MTVTELAPAKINLGLKIIRRRSDGFHDILSIFQTVTLFDELVISDGEPGLDCDRSGISLGPDNLVSKAGSGFRLATGFDRPVRFSLRKRIPAGAGLGGGSADAAATLRGLARMSRDTKIPTSLLLASAAKLGSDIPFLIDGGTAVVRGRGERIARTEWPFDFTYVLVYPGFGISTAWAYGQVRRYSGDGDLYAEAVERLETGGLTKELFFAALSNDFEDAVFPHHPSLAQIKATLIAHGAAVAFLTGSGSAMVGIFHDAETAGECANRMSANELELFVVKSATPAKLHK